VSLKFTTRGAKPVAGVAPNCAARLRQLEPVTGLEELPPLLVKMRGC
jgi:hypothetical protein